MKRPRLKVRTLLVGVAVLAVLLELVGLGQRSRHYAARAREASEVELNNQRIVHDAKIYLVQSLDEADRIASKEPERAAALRLNAERLTHSIPYLESQAVKAAKAKVIFERAMTHPWKVIPPMFTASRPRHRLIESHASTTS